MYKQCIRLFILLVITYKFYNNLYKISKMQNTDTYNYYELAVQKWCGQDKPYQIHGLWPQITNATYPEFCENIPYNSSIPPDLVDRMNNDWDNCENETSLWEHEWNKHGTCFAKQTNQDQMTYFNTALNMFDLVKNRTEKCNDKTECILACFDLDYNKIECEKN